MGDLSFPVSGNISSLAHSIRAQTVARTVVLAGDSIPQGGNGTVLSGATFSGSGTTGTITGVTFPIGSRIFITNASTADSVWNGVKTIASRSGSTATFINPTPLTASPTPAPSFSGIFVMSDAQENSRNFMATANGMMGLPFAPITNRAGSGRKTSDVLAAFPWDVLSLSPDITFELSGINDILQDYPTANDEFSPFNNRVAIAQLALKAGAKHIMATLPPLGTIAVGYSTARRDTVTRLNRLIRNFCQSTPGVVLVDFHKAVTDPVSGDWLPNFTQDGVHPTSAGAFAMAQALYTALSPWYAQSLPLVESQLDARAVDSRSRQIYPNPLMQGTGGSSDANITGTIANNLYCFRYAGTGATGVASVVSRDDGIGSNQKIVISDAAASDQIQIQGNASLHTQVTTGQVIQFKIDVKRSSVTGLRGVLVQLEGTASSIDFQVLASGAANSYDTTDDCDIAYQTPPFTIPAGLSYLRPVIRFQYGQSGGGTFEVGRFSVEILS